MAKNNADESMFAKCPYYKCENKCVIYCEGVQPNNCIHMAFGSKPQKKEFQKQFCREHWWKCMIAAAQNRAYGYEI